MDNDSLETQIVDFIFDSANKYALRIYEDENDHLLIDNDKNDIVLFSDYKSVQAYCVENNLIPVSEIDQVDTRLDSFVGADGVDCEKLITLWNVCTDIATSLSLPFLGDCYVAPFEHMYSKLFYGCNLFPIVGDRHFYNPTWTDSEIISLSALLHAMYKIIQCSLCNDTDSLYSYPQIRAFFERIEFTPEMLDKIEVVQLRFDDRQPLFFVRTYKGRRCCLVSSCKRTVCFNTMEEACEIVQLFAHNDCVITHHTVEAPNKTRDFCLDNKDLLHLLCEIADYCNTTFILDIDAPPFTQIFAEGDLALQIYSDDVAYHVRRLIADDASAILEFITAQSTDGSADKLIILSNANCLMAHPDFISTIWQTWLSVIGVEHSSLVALANTSPFKLISDIANILDSLVTDAYFDGYYDLPEQCFEMLHVVVRGILYDLCSTDIANENIDIKDLFSTDMAEPYSSIITLKHTTSFKNAREALKWWSYCERIAEQSGRFFLGTLEYGSIMRLKAHLNYLGDADLATLSLNEKIVLGAVVQDGQYILNIEG